jgi:tetratricopeptide (TPR) repeat protein
VVARRRAGSWWRLALAGVATVLFAAGTAWAQTPSGAAAGSLQTRYDEAFQETLRDPANLDVLFRFAGLAIETGDLEGAISALERMLIINPDLTRVRLELGVLYFRLGSYQAARSYLQAVLSSSSLPPEIRARAEQFMAEIQKRLSRSYFAGEAFVGWRYQSNANLGPSNSNVLLFGAPANLNQAATGSPDWGVVSSLQVTHRYDLATQDKAALETQFTGYANRQFQVSTTNVALLQLTTGPRFQVLSGSFEDMTLKPFLNVGYVWLYDTPYYGAYGGGLEVNTLLTGRLRNISTFATSQQDHPNTWYLPNNNQYNGTAYIGTTTFEYQLTETVSLLGNGTASRFQASLTPVQSYMLWALGGGMAFRFPDPLFRSLQAWTIGLAYAEQWWTYDAPDPTVDPNTMRYQLDSILSVTLSVPFDDRTTLRLSAGRFARGSSLPNYAFENTTGMFGVSWRF